MKEMASAMKMGSLGAGFSLEVGVVASPATSAATPGGVSGF